MLASLMCIIATNSLKTAHDGLHSNKKIEWIKLELRNQD